MYNDEDYKRGMKQLHSFKVDGSNGDPFVVGFEGTNKKLSEVQAARDFIASLLIDAIANKAEAKSAYEAKKTEYDMEVQRLMAEDPEVKNQKSADARKAQANVRAAQLQLEEHATKIDNLKADAYHDAVKLKYDHLESAYETVSRQMSGYVYKNNLGMSRSNNDLDNQSNNTKPAKRLKLEETE